MFNVVETPECCGVTELKNGFVCEVGFGEAAGAAVVVVDAPDGRSSGARKGLCEAAFVFAPGAVVVLAVATGAVVVGAAVVVTEEVVSPGKGSYGGGGSSGSGSISASLLRDIALCRQDVGDEEARVCDDSLIRKRSCCAVLLPRFVPLCRVKKCGFRESTPSLSSSFFLLVQGSKYNLTTSNIAASDFESGRAPQQDRSTDRSHWLT